MREIRLSGSEGGGAEMNRLFLPLSKLLQDLWNDCRPCALTRRFPGILNFSQLPFSKGELDNP